jgi:hypothetical protein
MSYAVKEIFYTLQGEATHAGRPAVLPLPAATLSGRGLTGQATCTFATRNSWYRRTGWGRWLRKPRSGAAVAAAGRSPARRAYVVALRRAGVNRGGAPSRRGFEVALKQRHRAA